MSWRDCLDEACGHPACGHGPERRFSDTIDLPFVDVLVSRTDAGPALEGGRLGILLGEGYQDDEAAGRRIAAALTKERGDWVCLYDLPVEATKHLEGLLWLLRQDVSFESCEARYHFPQWIAGWVAQGNDPAAIKGGATHMEYRLEVRDLGNAPALTQGELF